MSDQNKEAQAGASFGDHDQTHAKLLDDTAFAKSMGGNENENNLTGLTASAGGRRLYALGEGVSLTGHGIFHQFQHDWQHPKEFAGQVGMGLAFGVGMRMLLPKAGAARAIVGTAMTYFMAKDAFKPIAKMWGEAGQAKDMDSLHKSSANLGEGLGAFVAHTGVAVGAGMLGEMGTGALLGRSSVGRSYDAWKDDLWMKGQNKLLGRLPEPSSLTNDPGRSSLPFAEQITKIKESGLNGSVYGPVEPIKLDAKLVDNLQSKVDSRVESEKLYRSHEYSNKIDELLDKPASGSVGSAVEGPQSFAKNNDQVPAGAGKAEGGKAGDSTTSQPGTASGDNPVSTDKQAGKSSTKANDAASVMRLPGEISSDEVGSMAVAMRAAAAKWTQEKMQITQAKEDVAGPLIGAMRSGPAPLDAGHIPNNEMLLDLNGSIKTVNDARHALPLLDYFRTANQQMEIANHGDGHGISSIRHMNQYSRSIQAGVLQRLNELGIPLDVVRGSNAPLFTNRDSGGSGPHTIPAIPGVTDAAVINYAREYSGLEGVAMSGVYPHELGHDLVYGDLLRFPNELRDNILTEDVVGAAMKKSGIEDTVIDVPGSPNGTMNKSEFFAQLLKAEANENTADMFGTSIDPHTGLSLAVLLGSLRKPAGDASGPGALETRSMYGSEFVDPKMGNSLGIEPHGIDRWRIKLTAQTLREVSEGNKKVMEYADKLDGLAESMSRPGDKYVWANTDNPGQSVSIPQAEWDAIIPHLVKAQLDTPLEALNGNRLRDLSPNMSEVFNRVDSLSTSMAAAVLKGTAPLKNFDKSAYRIEDIYSAGLSSWQKAVELNAQSGNKVPVNVLMTRINKLANELCDQYVNDVPEAVLPGGIAFARSTAHPADAVLNPQGFVARSVGPIENQPKSARFMTKWAPGTIGNAGAHTVNRPLDTSLQDLLDHKRIQDQMIKDQAGGR